MKTTTLLVLIACATCTLASATKFFRVCDTEVYACWGYDPGTIDANIRFTDGTSKNYHPWPYTLSAGYCYTFGNFGGKIPAWVQVHDFGM